MLDTTHNAPMNGKKTAKLANILITRCYKAKLNNLEITTALGLLAKELLRDSPEDFFDAWIATLRSHLGYHDA